MLRRLAVVVLVLLVAGGAWLAYTFHQATALPDWYDPADLAQEEAPASEIGWVVVPEAGERAQPPTTEVPAPKRAKRRVLRNFHLRSAAKNPAARKAVRASRAVYEDGRLEAGLVINVSEIDRGKLKKADREFYERALEAFPSLKNRDVYVGIEDEPSTADGYLQLGPDTQVRIGDLRYSLNRVARKLGLSRAKVRKQINAEFVRLKLTDPDAPPEAPADED